MQINLDRNAKPEESSQIRERLKAYNFKHTGRSDYRTFTLYARDEAGELKGGLIAESFWGWLFIEILWVDESMRGKGVGKDLLRRAEDEGRATGCKACYLDTFSFQARPFYESQGYRVVGTIDDFPDTHKRFYLTKPL